MFINLYGGRDEKFYSSYFWGIRLEDSYFLFYFVMYCLKFLCDE